METNKVKKLGEKTLLVHYVLVCGNDKRQKADLESYMNNIINKQINFDDVVNVVIPVLDGCTHIVRLVN